MSNLVSPGARACLKCLTLFTPKVGGYNGRYCSDRCKRAAQRARVRANRPEQLKNARARSWNNTVSHPIRYDAHLASGRRGRQSVQEWLNNYKMERGCVDCGWRVHPAALHLDHEGLKSVEIAQAKSSLQRLKNEIIAGQCQVRCANCHSIRTWERKKAAKALGVRVLTAADLTPITDLLAPLAGKIGRGCD